MDRLYAWVGLTFLSVVNIGAIVDQFDERNGKQNYALATACVSFIFGAFLTASNIVDSLRVKVVGNTVENSIAAAMLAMWVVAIAFIQSPENGFATAISGEGKEMILYANLYFFSWMTFLLTVYLVGSSFRDNFQFGPKFSQWTLLFTASIVLLSTSVALREDICDNADETTCERTKYAVGVGGVGIGISSLAVIASIFGIMGRILEIGMVVLSFVLYFFGVVFLTSSSGPASSMGNMYFAVWGGCFVSFMLMIDSVVPGRGHGTNSEQERTGVDEENL
jgi:hypothetical protein